MKTEEKHLLELLIFGKNAVWFWFFVIGGMLIPTVLLVFRKGPVIPRIVVASVLITVAMWIKRFVIVVPPLQVPLMPFEFGSYSPTWIEWSITAGSFAAFMLIFAIFVKLVPLISIWEVAEEIESEATSPPEEIPERGSVFAERRGL